MSLYDKASLFYSAAAGAWSGQTSIADHGINYNVKPVEELYVDELIGNTELKTDDGWDLSDSNITISDQKIVFDSPAQYATARWDTSVMEAKKTYKVSFRVEDFQGDLINSKILVQEANNEQIDVNVNQDGRYSFYYTVPEGNTHIHAGKLQFKTVTTSVRCKISDISLREVKQKANDFEMTRHADLTATTITGEGYISKATENLVKYSNEFDNAVWSNYSVTLTGEQPGYDNKRNAWKMARASGDGSCQLTQTLTSTTPITTWSFYVKPPPSDDANTTWDAIVCRFDPADGSPFGFEVIVRLSDGGVISGGKSTSGKPNHTIVSAGNGYWRVSISADEPVDEVKIISYDESGSTTSVTSGDYVFIQHAQLEEGTVPTAPIITDGVSRSRGLKVYEPRLDYGLTWSGSKKPSLLLEPTRVNLIAYSEYFSGTHIGGVAGGYYGRNNVTAVTHETVIRSPDRYYNATRLEETTANAGHYLTRNISVTNGTTYTVSVFARARERSILQISPSNAYLGSGYGNFNLSNGTTGDKSSNVTTEIYTCGDNWYRCSLTFTATATASGDLALYIQKSASAARGATYQGETNTDGDGKSLRIYGLQLEAGPYATSYIPTHGATATRNRETFTQYKDIPKLNMDKFTFYVHTTQGKDQDSNRGPRMAGDGNSTLMGYYIDSSENKRFFLYDNDLNVALNQYTFNGFEAGDETKYAFAVDNIALNAKLYINGSYRASFSLTERADASKITSSNGATGRPDNIRSIMYFPEVLSQGELEDLTSVS